MTDSSQDSSLATARHLRRALDAIGNALAGARLDDLLESETLISAAVATLPPRVLVEAEAHAELARELVAVRAALLRCRRLGASLSDFVRICLDAQGAAAGYDRSGRQRLDVAGGALDARA